MPAHSRQYVGILFFIVGLFVLSVALAQAQEDEPEQEELLRADARPRLRVLNASDQLPLADVFLNGTLYFPDLPAGCISGYLPLPVSPPVQQHSIQIRPGDSEEEEFTAVLEQEVEAGRDYTLLIFDGPGGLEPAVIVDDNERAISPGQASLRLVRAASPDVPGIEVCIAENCALLTPEERVSNYIEVDGGAYNLKLRLIGTDQLYFDVWPVMLQTGEVHSIFVLGPEPDMVKPQVMAYVDTDQLPAYPIAYPKQQPVSYPCLDSGRPPSYSPPVNPDQPLYPPDPPVPQPDGGYVPPPVYPPVTGAFLSPVALGVVVVVIAALLGGSWLAWRRSRKSNPSLSG